MTQEALASAPEVRNSSPAARSDTPPAAPGRGEGVGVAHVRADGTWAHANDRLCDLLGYPREELVARPFEEALHPGDVEAGRALVRRLLAGEADAGEAEVRYVRKDGRVVWALLTVTAVATAEGVRLVATVRDDTARKLEGIVRERVERAHRASEARANRLALVASYATAGVLITGPDRRVEWVNPAFERLSGYAAAEVVGRAPGPFLTGPHTDPAALAAIEEARARRAPFEVEVWNRRKTGTSYCARVEGQPLADAAGAFCGYMAVLTDVTDRRLAEAALRASEARYRTVVETIREVVFQTDVAGRWTFLNPAWAELTGRPVAEALGHPVLHTIHPEDRTACAEGFHALVQGAREELRATLRALPRDGEPRWLEVAARATVDAAGRATGTAGTLRDVTEERRATAALEAALERERELGELKARFVSMASHELRTPLATIQSSTELVGRFLARGDAEKVAKHLARIGANVREMTELLEDVLLMGKAEEGRLTFDPQPVELLAWVHEVVEQARLGVGARHHLELTTPDLPVPAVVDRKLLGFALGNLLSNAAKYSEPGTTVAVTLEVDEEVEAAEGAAAGVVRLAVRDAGIGIPEADLPHLFEAFRRAGNVGTRRGTGLGLSITHRAVVAHGGRIAVESALGAGSTFTLHVPLHYP